MTTIISSPRGPITLRAAVREDGAAVRTLRLEALIKHPEVFTSDYSTNEAQTAEMWGERIANGIAQNQGATFIASAGEDLIAMCGVTCGPSSKTRHSGMIWGVYVKEEWRGLHIAEAMIHACLKWGREQEMVLLKLGVLTVNTSAIRCYSRCGFSLFGIEPKAVFVNGVFYDEILMSRLL